MRHGAFGYGLIGCGWVASAHAWGVKALESEGVELVAVADVDPTRAQAIADRFGAEEVYLTPQELLERPDIDAVSVCVPDYLHHDVVMAAAAAGKHVLCEKPLAMTVAQADEMVEACRNAGVALGLVMNHRYAPDNIRAKNALVAGAIGQPVLGTVIHSSGLTGNPAESSTWRGRAGRAAGGVLSTQAIHFLDLLLWFLGPVAAVRAFTARSVRTDQDHEDTVSIALRMDSGALATLAATNASPIMDDFTGTRIELHGSEGWIRLDGDVLKNIDVAYDVASFEVRLPEAPEGAEEIVFGTGHVHEVIDFVRAVRDGAEAPVSGVDGRHLMAVIEAAYKSAAEGREILVSEPHDAYPNRLPANSLLNLQEESVHRAAPGEHDTGG